MNAFPIRATKRTLTRLRASKHMRPEMIRGIKKKAITTMHTFLPPPAVAGRTLDTEIENAKGVVQDAMNRGTPMSMDRPMKRMRRGATRMLPPGGLMPP